MITNTSTTDLKTAPHEHVVRHHAPDVPTAPPTGNKPRKRGIIWILLLLVVVGVTGYAVWRAGQPGLVAQPPTGGRNGRGRGPGAFGPQPVVVSKAKKMTVPVYLTGLGNVSAF